ncbi:MAG: hypothetical protein MI739_04895, partial [Bacteroidales bacterium]|nr:hypothetical protein [Bacteroidales bacterium]
IYHKAPIVMSHLENIIGENKLQEGIHEYLSQNMYSNATWDDLIDILDSKTQQNLNQWSHAWVYESEMPYYSVFPEYNSDNQLSGVTIKQNDPKSKNRLWTQDMQITSFNNNSANRQKQTLNKQHTNINFNEKPNYVLYNSDGLAYGYFELDSLSKINLLQKASKLENPVNRCAAYICLWENLMNNNLKPLDLFNTYIESVAIETNAQNVNLVLGYIKTIYWRFLSNDTRKKVSIDIENLLWDKMNRSKNISIKASLFKAYYNVVISNKGLIQLLNIWNKTTVIKGLHLSERDFTKIALELAVKSQDERTMIISSQKKRITDSEKKIQFKFISEAITNPDVFFESLKDEKNREKEPWVGKALRYLHHPTRSSKAIKYIYPSLEILEELQATGDIFFPKQWLDAIFSGHSSIEACNEIERFLSTHPNYPLNLKNKILQSSDLVFRAKDLK